VEFVQKLRDEVRYDTLPELTAAIARDAEQARALLRAAHRSRAAAQATI
jgi:riboflavin kinase/FMN adenylyltransferase